MTTMLSQNISETKNAVAQHINDMQSAMNQQIQVQKKITLAFGIVVTVLAIVAILLPIIL